MTQPKLTVWSPVPLTNQQKRIIEMCKLFDFGVSEIIESNNMPPESSTLVGIRRASMILAFGKLAAVLQLPNGIKITDAYKDHPAYWKGQAGLILNLEGPGLPAYCETNSDLPTIPFVIAGVYATTKGRVSRFKKWRVFERDTK